MAKQNFKSLFLTIAKSRGYKISKPSFHERKNNVDFILEGQSNGNPTIVKIDLKKKNANNPNHWVYIEFENSKGGQGWLHGISDFIVFETGKSFIFVPRKALLNMLSNSSLVRWDLPYVDKAWYSKYRLFRRPNTLETTSQINVKDLLSVKGVEIWPKK
jgi:hypothetical protein